MASCIVLFFLSFFFFFISFFILGSFIQGSEVEGGEAGSYGYEFHTSIEALDDRMYVIGIKYVFRSSGFSGMRETQNERGVGWRAR